MKIKKFQQGGDMPSVQETQSQPQNTDPLMEIASIMAQGLQTGDCNALAQACEMFLSLLSQAQGSTQEPIGQPMANSQPVFKKGGKLIKRKKCGK